VTGGALVGIEPLGAVQRPFHRDLEPHGG
jgi:hypothetical protein